MCGRTVTLNLNLIHLRLPELRLYRRKHFMTTHEESMYMKVFCFDHVTYLKPIYTHI